MALKGDDLGSGNWKKQRLRVLNRDAWTCGYCGQEANEVDHIIPRKSGGGHELENLIAACRTCNLAKAARSESVFLSGRSTPPVFAERLSPTRSREPRTSPFRSKNFPDQ
jgi:5-methylcytosine-specific restriction endonuclease McrA